MENMKSSLFCVSLYYYFKYCFNEREREREKKKEKSEVKRKAIYSTKTKAEFFCSCGEK